MSRRSSINQKIDREINAILDRIRSKNEASSDEDPDHDDVVEVSELSRDQLDGEGNVTSSIVEKRFENESALKNDINDVKALVAVKNDYNEHRTQLVDTTIKAGLTVVSILVMLGFEVSHSITTRTLGFMPKPKI